MKDSSRIAFVVPFYNGDRYIERCLVSIQEADSSGLVQTIVVNNSDRPTRIHQVARQFRNTHVLDMEARSGFGRACNAGVGMATQGGAGYVLCINQDGIIADNFLFEIMAGFEGEDKIVMAAPIAFTYDFRNIEPSFITLYLAQCPDLFYDSLHSSIKKKYEVAWVSGACFAIQADFVRKYGLFDPIYFMYHEDEDLCRRIRYLGRKIVIVPGARFAHFDANATIKGAERDRLGVWQRYSGSVFQIKDVRKPFFESLLTVAAKRVLDYPKLLLRRGLGHASRNVLTDLSFLLALPSIGRARRGELIMLRAEGRISHYLDPSGLGNPSPDDRSIPTNGNCHAPGKGDMKTDDGTVESQKADRTKIIGEPWKPTDPLVSVSMITYNHAPYIGRAIEGVLRQKVEFPIELIIGEDCSTDRTREIVFKYQDRYPDIIKVVTSERNVGANRNVDRVKQACRGKYIAICEGDDYWHNPEKLQKQVDYLECHPGCGLVYSSYDVDYVKSGKKIKDYIRHRKWIMPEKLTVADVILAKGPMRVGVLLCTVVARRALVEAISMADPHLFGDRFLRRDMQLIAEVVARSNVHYIPESLATYNQTEESATRSRDIVKILRLQISDAELGLYLCDKYNLPSSVRNEIEDRRCNGILRLAFRIHNRDMADEAKSIKRTLTFKEWLMYFGTKYSFVRHSCDALVSCRNRIRGEPESWVSEY